MALEPGQVIDSKYKVIRHIGEGGMGTVYEGENTRIARRVAIKVLHARVAAMADFVVRFEREAQAVARIGSQHVCDVLDLGDLPNGDRYIVMEFLDGISFEDRLVERVKLTPAQLAPIAFELLEGLGTMHVAGVIHRDLKPANVFLARTSGGRGEVVKILDFGVAKLQPLAGEVGSMTQTGTMMGTPLYMSPEQARGARDVDGRTDIYAASVMFYRALTGVLPYNAETLNELLFKIVLEDPKPLREIAPEVDEVFAAMVHKGLARELPQRFQNARAFQEEIVAWGKTQGRSSLSFAVTHASEKPPNTPNTLPDPSHLAAKAGALPASGAGAAAAGTPIAWSEGAPGNGSSPHLVAAATVLTPISAQPPQSPVAGVVVAPAAGAGWLSPTPATKAPSSNETGPSPVDGDLSTSKPSTVEGLAIAHARTGPAAPIDDAATPVASSSAASTKKSPRALLFGIVGAGALAVASIVAFGRGRSAKPEPNILTATASPSGAPVPLADSSAAKTTPSAAELPTGTAATAPVPDGATIATSSASATDPQTTAHPATRRAEGATKQPTAMVAAATATPAPSATAATAPTTLPSSTAAKPAGSARKFRTNLD